MKIENVQIDALDFASQGNAILGIRDSGKTYTATWLAERLLDESIPFVAFDPIGVWRYLKVGKGKNAGYPIVVAGDDGDLPLNAETAPNIVRAAMQENIPLVLDLYSMELSKAQWKQIVEQSVRLLLYENKKYGARHVFIEEASEFVPQRIGPDQGRVYAEIEKLAKMGRNASLGYTIINQRAEEVNKAVLELCDCLFLHRQKGRHSITALDKWLSIADTSNAKEVSKSLPTLAQGECWIWQEGSDTPRKIHVPEKKTVHPNPKNPKLTSSGIPADVSMFVDRLNTSLKKQQRAVEIKTESTKSSNTKSSAPALSVGNEITRLENENAELKETISKLEETLREERVRANEAEHRLKAVRDMLEPQYKQMQILFSDHLTVAHSGGVSSNQNWDIWLAKLQGKKRDMLSILIERGRVTKNQLGLLVGMSAKGGSFNTYLSSLRSLGLVKSEGDEIVLQDMGNR